MDRTEFWRLLETSRPQSGDCLQQARNVEKQLTNMDPAAVASFHCHLQDLLQTSYRADLWDIADIVLDDCSDSMFEGFRAWLLLQGEEVFKAILTAPERSAAYLDLDVEPSCRRIVHAAPTIYHDRTGSWDIPGLVASNPPLIGTRTPRAALQSKYSEVWSRFQD